MPTSSAALAVTAIVPDTAAPDAGDVIATVGGLVSVCASAVLHRATPERSTAAAARRMARKAVLEALRSTAILPGRLRHGQRPGRLRAGRLDRAQDDDRVVAIRVEDVLDPALDVRGQPGEH